MAYLRIAIFIAVAFGSGVPGLNANDKLSDAPGPLRILFVGNSHLFVNDVPARVAHLLEVDAAPIITATFTVGGARLTHFTRRADVAAALADEVWDVVVLQEATASFLTPEGRRQFHRALQWFLGRIPPRTRTVLYQTWPWRNDSRYFRGRSSTARLWRAMMHEYGRLAALPRVVVAPVGRCWLSSPHRARFYSADGNHASVAGSQFAARVLADTILRGRPRDCSQN